MDLRLDHVFLTVQEGEPAVDRLLNAGFEEGPPDVHQGQGTKCRRIFFGNAYLEFLWLEDPVAASSPAVMRTKLRERLELKGEVSRIGIALRPADGQNFDPPVETWAYQPPYLPEGRSIPMGTNSVMVKEPLLFFMPWGQRWEAPRIPHPNGTREVTGLVVSVPRTQSETPYLDWLSGVGCILVKEGSPESITIELDEGRQGQEVSLAPDIPLCLKW